ncbi:MAG: FAD-dependent oxidoreductase [Rhodobiaceae bacterium]|nr:FAD-dependent oxidoreductase [Rhodobiaceae bacterium]MCC0056538.1 FAD-dependent oxidoreductase [Rhodobiaceae bacterium]
MQMTGEFAARRVAVIGSGIAGASAAWLLSKSCNVVLYEADNRLGGHANTVEAPTPAGPVPVDTGFIVFNDRNYPNLCRLFDWLDVPTEASDMSFAASIDDGRFEYSGTGVGGLLGQRSNAVRPRFWRMAAGIMRFYREAPAVLEDASWRGASLGDYLAANGYGETFVEDHLLPMGAAIWSTTARQMREYPVQAFVRFFERHGLLSLSDRPRWRTVSGGSREYVRRLFADYAGEVRLASRVAEIRRDVGRVTVTDHRGNSDIFDAIVIAAHADQALSMLGDPSADERRLLGAISYTANEAVLHRDPSAMPRRRSVWSSWNYIGRPSDADCGSLCVTYWMNRLQNLPMNNQLFVTLNPTRPLDAESVIARFEYDHPLYDARAMAAQEELWTLQGRRNTWFCGSYFGYGFHEDGLRSGLEAAEAVSGMRRPFATPVADAEPVHAEAAE